MTVSSLGKKELRVGGGLASFLLYISSVYNLRYFCIHLTFSDLRNRFRRSYLGIFWIVLQPMMLTIIIAVVLSFVFGQPFRNFSVYAFIGIVVWDFIGQSVNLGASSLVTAEGYLKQKKTPIVIFPLKSALHAAVSFLIAFVGVVIFELVVLPSAISIAWFFFAPAFIVTLLICIPIAIMSAITAIKFRDFPQAIALFLQIIWYVSPIFIMKDVFDRPYLREWTNINPVSAILDLFRAPMMDGAVPALHSYMVAGIWGGIFWIIAAVMVWRNESKIIFYF